MTYKRSCKHARTPSHAPQTNFTHITPTHTHTPHTRTARPHWLLSLSPLTQTPSSAHTPSRIHTITHTFALKFQAVAMVNTSDYTIPHSCTHTIIDFPFIHSWLTPLMHTLNSNNKMQTGRYKKQIGKIQEENVKQTCTTLCPVTVFMGVALASVGLSQPPKL